MSKDGDFLRWSKQFLSEFCFKIVIIYVLDLKPDGSMFQDLVDTWLLLTWKLENWHRSWCPQLTDSLPLHIFINSQTYYSSNFHFSVSKTSNINADAPTRSAKANGRVPKTCLGRVFNCKLVCFEDVNETHVCGGTTTSIIVNSVQVSSCQLKFVHGPNDCAKRLGCLPR